MRIPSASEINRWIAEGREDKVYKQRYWTNLIRPTVMKRCNNECSICKSKGKHTKANYVHHIKELKQYPENAYDLNNLIAVCWDCHEEIHERFKYKLKKENVELNDERW
ncbi:HNH endonuclease signature motif containing protein [Anaerorhabdus sp.]|uniref:HNH endonuclease signature motif containing protein n=1 Tax=Anaerorhabdus sp. TaxID=1872524 RepID=UPI002FCADB7E